MLQYVIDEMPLVKQRLEVLSILSTQHKKELQGVNLTALSQTVLIS